MRRTAAVLTLCALLATPVFGKHEELYEPGPNCQQVCSDSRYVLERIECTGEGSRKGYISKPAERFIYPDVPGIEVFMKKTVHEGFPDFQYHHFIKMNGFLFNTFSDLRGTSIYIRAFVVENGKIEEGYEARLPLLSTSGIIAKDMPPIFESISSNGNSVPALTEALVAYSNDKWGTNGKYFVRPLKPAQADWDRFSDDLKKFRWLMCP